MDDDLLGIFAGNRGLLMRPCAVKLRAQSTSLGTKLTMSAEHSTELGVGGKAACRRIRAVSPVPTHKALVPAPIASGPSNAWNTRVERSVPVPSRADFEPALAVLAVNRKRASAPQGRNRKDFGLHLTSGWQQPSTLRSFRLTLIRAGAINLTIELPPTWLDYQPTNQHVKKPAFT